MALEVQESDNRINSQVPIWLKVLLTPEEASVYSGIGINKIRSMLNSPDCKFVLFYGNRKLVKRKELEKYLLNNSYI